MADAAIVFLHGLGATHATWDRLAQLIETDPGVGSKFDLMRPSYPSPKSPFKANITRRIPDYNSLADWLGTYLKAKCASHQRVVIITHSQGGLILQRYLSNMLIAGRARELTKIRCIVHICCPHRGSEFLLALRKIVYRSRHPQERDLRPSSSATADALFRVYDDIYKARYLTKHKCPIRLYAYYAIQDGVADQASSKGPFRRAGGLAGDHSSVIQITSHDHETFVILRQHLERAYVEPFPKIKAHRQASQESIRDFADEINGGVDYEANIDIVDRQNMRELRTNEMSHRYQQPVDTDEETR